MISVIIATDNDETSIRDTIAYVYANVTYKRLLKEVIVVDAGSPDRTLREAARTGATVMISPKRGRAAQLNYGARQASGDILYFLPSRSIPPSSFLGEIAKAVSKGFACGTFCVQFPSTHWTLSLLAWLVNRPASPCLADQGLFVTRSFFLKTNGFNENHVVMVNQEFVIRAKRYSDFAILQERIVLPVFKYTHRGFITTTAVQAFVYWLYKQGYSDRTLTRIYRALLKWNVGPEPRQDTVEPPDGISVTADSPALSGG